MTTEEKAKAYDEALERARKLYEQGTITESLGYVFPELKESEDERIRKAIISGMKSLQEKGKYTEFAHIPMNDVFAWLEKQGEQKPTIEMITSEESLGIDSETYNKIVDECIYGEKKSQRMISAEAKEAMYDKPAWSEKDEQHIDSLLKRLDGLCRNEFERTRFAINEDEDWLKSLKVRI